MDMVLSHIRNTDTKMKFVTLWAGKEARTYLTTVEEDHKSSLRAILDTLKDWTKPKLDEIAAFTHLIKVTKPYQHTFKKLEEL